MERDHMAMSKQKEIVENTGLFKIIEFQGLMILAARQS